MSQLQNCILLPIFMEGKQEGDIFWKIASSDAESFWGNPVLCLYHPYPQTTEGRAICNRNSCTTKAWRRPEAMRSLSLRRDSRAAQAVRQCVQRQATLLRTRTDDRTLGRGCLHHHARTGPRARARGGASGVRPTRRPFRPRTGRPTQRLTPAVLR